MRAVVVFLQSSDAQPVRSLMRPKSVLKKLAQTSSEMNPLGIAYGTISTAR